MSERLRLWGLRLLALGIAVGVWLAVSVSKRNFDESQKTLGVSITYQIPRGLVLLNPTEQIDVTFRGNSEAVAQLAPFMVGVEVPVEATEPGQVTIGLSSENVRLPPGEQIEVTALDPNRLTLQLDRQVTRRLPLEPSFTGEPAAGARVRRDEVVIEPPFAVVTGPASVVDDLESLDLTPINLNGHALTFEENASVITPEGKVQVVENSRVRVLVPMDLGRDDDAAEGGSSPSDSG